MVTLLVALELFELVVEAADEVDVAGCAELEATVDVLRAASAGS